MLDKGIFAAVLLVAAILVLLVLWTCWRYWLRGKGSPLDKVSEPEPAALQQPLLAESQSFEAACLSFRTPDEVLEAEALGLETGQTLKRRFSTKLLREESFQRSKSYQDGEADPEKRQLSVDTESQRNLHGAEIKPHIGSSITLEVISGPARGICVTHPSGQSIAIGRVPLNNLVVNDPEVSGKHACIKWNSEKSLWELVDLGSLNGTLLNDQTVSFEHSNGSAVRKPGIPFALETGDVVSLGSVSQVLVHIVNNTNGAVVAITPAPFDIGIAADAMSVRRGGRRLPMEDVCFYEWPLRGHQQIGAFCVFDGHGGVAAAQAASKIMPEKLSEILRVDSKRAGMLNNLDASDVLRDAFNATEDALDHEYEGCTATVLLVWLDTSRVVYAQCANVGDSACIFSVGGKYVSMTEDHRVTSFSERSRMLEMGKQLLEGETRLCGMNIARALGDKFLKEQDPRFSSQPFISEVLRITKDSNALAVIASDGLWDVLSQRRVWQLALEAREGQYLVEGTKVQPLTAKGIAEMLVNKSRSLRTKDNSSVIVVDFVVNSKP